MTIYKGKVEDIKGPIIAVMIISAVIFSLFVFLNPGVGIYITSVILLMILSFAYKGIILRITLDESKIVVVKPLTRTVIKINDIAFCAVHSIDEERSIIYAFMRQRLGKSDSVKGVKPKKSFNEIVNLVSKHDDKADLDVNFNMAAKIPISFVENGEKLKEKILEKVSENQMNIMKSN